VNRYRLIIATLAVFALAQTSDALAAGGGTSPGAGGGGAGTSAGASASPAVSSNTGGAGLGLPPAPKSSPRHPTVVGSRARIRNGVAYAPSWAPIQVQRAIWAGNQIRRKPYIWGGGHGSFTSSGYDCSGSVSYVLHAAGLLNTPYSSVDFFNWGKKGLGRWITVYTNSGHAFIEIAGIRLDTSSEGEERPLPGTWRGSGPRWRHLLQNTGAFQPRHFLGY
jgi:hypothetical protein